jgi:Flp pilus assembly CpaF family ATPase
MLSQSIKSHDLERTLALKRSLLNVEKKTDSGTVEEETRESPRHTASARTSCPSTASKDEIEGKTAEETASFSPSEVQYLEKAIHQNTKWYDIRIDILLVGDPGTGKTTLVNALTGSRAPPAAAAYKTV